MDTNKKYRHIIILIIFLTICGMLIYRLYDLQIVNGEMYFENSSKNVVKSTNIIAPRGNIYDRNGVLIAGVSLKNNLRMKIININSKQKNDIYLETIEILHKNNEEYKFKLTDYLSITPISFWTNDINKIKDWQMKVFGLDEKNSMLNPLEFFLYLKNDLFKIERDITDELVYEVMCMRYEELVGKDLDTSFDIAKKVSEDTLAEVNERSNELIGLWTEESYDRVYYNDEYAAHILGYVNYISPEEYDELKIEGYSINDKIGRTGIEYEMERYLKGENGKKWIEQDAEGNYINDIMGVPAKAGNDIVLSIDMQLQETAYNAIKQTIEDIKQKGGSKNYADANAGAVVAIDVNTGEILALASYPTYDPSVFLAGTGTYNSDEIVRLENDETKPLFNRAIQGTYAPGSTFKPLTATAALEENIITKDQKINDIGYLNIGNKDFYCLEYVSKVLPHGHGRINLEEALAASCNIYFHQIGFWTGIDNISKWAGIFRLGEYTGIDIPGEAKGIRPSQEYKKATFNDIWRPADTAQIAIGQLYNAYTPLQLACYVSTIANGGIYYRPHVVKSVNDKYGIVINRIDPEKEILPIKKETIEAIKAGMVAVANSVDGTAVHVFREFPFKVAGKTGTAETGNEKNSSSNALFISYAPADNPQIAVAVVVEKGVWGSNTAPIAKEIMEKYFEIYGDELYNKGENKKNTLLK